MQILPKNKSKFASWLFNDNKLFIGKLNSHGTRYRYFLEFNLPPGLIADGEVKDRDGLAKSLQLIKSKLPLKDKYVVVGLPSQQCLAKPLDLPGLDIKEVDQAVGYQVDNMLPLPASEEYFDWMLLEEENKKVKKVLVCATPKKVIDNFLWVLHQIGLYPIAFEPLLIAAFRALPDEVKKLSLVAEIDGDTATLLLCQGGVLLANSLIKSTEKFSLIATEMVDYYLPGLPVENRPKKVFLFGNQPGEALLTDIKTNSWEAVVLRQPIAGIPSGKEAELFSFISLSNKDVCPADNCANINLLPRDLADEYWNSDRQKKERRYLTIVSLLIITFALAIFGGYYLVNQKLNQIRQKLVINQSQITQLAGLTSQVAKIKLVDSLPNRKESLLKYLDTVEDTGGLVTLTGITVDDDKREIVLIGKASAWFDLITYRDRLEEAKTFKKISVPLSYLGKDNLSEFRLTLSY